MKNKELTNRRNELNKLMAETDSFFKEFGLLDDKVYQDGAISKKNKELMGLAISAVAKCDECILYHINGCLNSQAIKEEIIEAIKIGVVAGGSITYPNARFAFEMLKELKAV